MAKYSLSDIFQGNYRVSQPFGANPQYYKQFGLQGHEGVDWATPIGVQVLCPFERGIVLRASSDRVYGYSIVIWDPKQKCAVWYCHLSKITAGYGSQVKRGQVVGRTGNSGNSSGPHLHVNFVETDVYGNRLNRTNGYQGFRNILRGDLVSWRLTR
jgi:murein DD-endopeptidase MepM/ murein hydrolase activator NlpD